MRKAFSMTDETMPKDEARPVVTVTEGDREAMIAYEMARAIPLAPVFVGRIRAGVHDADDRIQAFARYRIAAQSEAAARVTVLEGALRSIARGKPFTCKDGTIMNVPMRDRVAQEIARSALQGEGAGS